MLLWSSLNGKSQKKLGVTELDFPQIMLLWHKLGENTENDAFLAVNCKQNPKSSTEFFYTLKDASMMIPEYKKPKKVGGHRIRFVRNDAILTLIFVHFTVFPSIFYTIWLKLTWFHDFKI